MPIFIIHFVFSKEVYQISFSYLQLLNDSSYVHHTSDSINSFVGIAWNEPEKEIGIWDRRGFECL